jgi:beta-1,4-mannosyltransferase
MIRRSSTKYVRVFRAGAQRIGAATVVASYPASIVWNPYQALLYRHLANEGLTVVGTPRLCIGSLWRNRRRIDALHFHWPQEYYRYDRGSPTRRAVLSWVRLAVFSFRIAAARLLGYRIVWTVHQLYPHETESQALERAAALVLARLSHYLIAHDRGTATALARELGAGGDKTCVIPHGSYIGVYPEGRPRNVVRAELGIPGDAFVVLSFGQVRKYKDLTLLVEAFERTAINHGLLLIAGLPLDQREAQRLEEMTGGTPRVMTVLEYVPDDRVAELFRASDVAVSARGDGGTSGALILALSMGLPVVAASTAAYVELTGGGRAGWHFTPGSPDSLCAALRSAAADPRTRAAKARSALEQARQLTWPEIAARTAPLLRSPPHRQRRSRS